MKSGLDMNLVFSSKRLCDRASSIMNSKPLPAGFACTHFLGLIQTPFAFLLRRTQFRARVIGLLAGLRRIGIALALWFSLAAVDAADLQAPGVLSVVPPQGGSLSALSQVRITFDEAVTGVEANALLINGHPASSVSGLSNQWTFLFSQPFPGTVSIQFAQDHAISDLSGNRLDGAAPSSSWSYVLIDTVAPTVTSVTPSPGAVVSELTSVTLWFSEPVSGVDAGDLLINGQPATSVQGSDLGPYVFQMPKAGDGPIALSWNPAHGIQDLAAIPNPFAGSGWTYSKVPAAASGDLILTEILAENQNGLRDEDGDNEDWIELWNRGATEVNLLGWSLSDDASNPSLWTFPDVTLPSGGYLVVFASGKDRRAVGGGARLHANFRLSGAGETVSLFDASSPRRRRDSLTFPEQRTDISYGRRGDGLTYFAQPTPGAANGQGTVFNGMVAAPVASVKSGFFRDPLTVYLSSDTFGAQIFYTLDGSAPTAQSPRYSKPLSLVGTAKRAVVTLRAVALRDGMLPSSVTTHTYLYPEQILSQPAAPAGFPTTWVTLNNPEASASTTADYEMDQKVVTNKNNRELILKGLASLPTVSIVTATPLLFGNNGVYSRRNDTNQQPVHIEMILPDGQIAFRQDCGLEIQGGSSTTDAGSDWKSKNLSMRLLFRGDFGPGKLAYPLYDGSTVEEFDTLVLDAELNMVWNHMTDADQRNRGQYAREQFLNDMMQGTGILAPRGRYVHLYLNGLYWGMKNLHERPDSSWASHYMGGDPSEYDVFKHEGTSTGLQEGTMASYNTLLNVARSGLAKNTAYEALQQHLDMDWFIDYMLVNFYGGNTDWDNHNWYAVRRRTPGAPGWRFVSWDAEHVLKDANEDRTSINNSAAPSEIFQALRGNAEFRLRFADHVHRHFFNGGIFYVDRTNRNWNPAHPEWNRPAAAYMKVIQQIDPAIVAESARWGDVARPGQAYTRDVEWMRELQSLLFITNSPGNTVNYFPTRSSNVLSSFRVAKLYPTVEAPTFSQHGGQVPAGFAVSMSAPAGVIVYTTNGADPRVYGAGTVAPSAATYLVGKPVVLNATQTLKARTLLNGTNWSALNEATFTVAELGSKLRFSEIHYNPPGGDAYEFVELQNFGSSEVDLSLATVEGIGFAFGPGASLSPGGSLVLIPGVNTNAWRARYPGVPVAGVYPGTLSNGGERLVLRDRRGVLLTSVDYSDSGIWPRSADGAGRSLELVNPWGDPDDASNWRASLTVNGSPGLPSAEGPKPAVLLNEIRAADDAGNPDFVEIVNAGGATVDLAGWSLSNGGGKKPFVFGPGTFLEAGKYLVILCDTNQGAGLHSGFGLDRDGDDVFLSDTASNRVDALVFGQQIPGYTLGRVSGAWVLTLSSPGLANSPAPAADATSLTINEWLANAAPGGEDWLELYNTSASLPVALQGIFLGNGKELMRLGYPAFVAPKGFVRLWADEQSGPSHLDFKLAASGGSVLLYDAAGRVLETDGYAATAPGVSVGRLPDGGASPFVAFPGSASPGSANYLVGATGPVITEIMAWNRAAVPGPSGNFPDWVEIWNPYATNLVLEGYRFVREEGSASFAIPAGSTLAPGAYQILWCDDSKPATTSAGPVWNTGFALPAAGATVALLDAQDRVVSSVEFGSQVADRSIGLNGQSWTLLSAPTPGLGNAAAVALGSVASVRINEWMAVPESGDDWVELYNGDAAPVMLTGIWITDDPSSTGIRKTQMGPLSFVDAGGFVTFIADGHPSKGPGHLKFQLDSDGGVLRLYTSELQSLDSVSFGPQTEGVSQGRFPDGGADLVSFTQTASLGVSNWLPLPGVLIQEVLSRAAAPGGDFIELLNRGDAPIDVGGWYLSDRLYDLRRYRIPAGRSVPAHGLLVLSTADFGGSFRLDSANDGASANDEFSAGDEVILSAAETSGALTGYRTSMSFGAAEVGHSVVRLETSLGDQWVSVAQATPGAPNSAFKAGPIVINEIHGSAEGANGAFDFIELQNVSSEPVSMRDPAAPQRGWKLRGGVDYNFPPSTELAPRSFALIVGFDPALDAAALAAFRAHYALPLSVQVLGPWSGQLHLGQETLRLEKPSGVEPLPRPSAGEPVYVLVDEIRRQPLSLWPAQGSDEAQSLQRRRTDGFGNEPLNWFADQATPGRANRPDSTFTDADHDGLPDAWEASHGFNPGNASDADSDTDADGFTAWQEYQMGTSPSDAGSKLVAPILVSSPASQTIGAGKDLTLSVGVTGTEPLRYQWWFRGLPLMGATQASLVLKDIQSDFSGEYYAVAGNALGSVRSDVARLAVVNPPAILEQPQSLAVNPGSNVTLRVVAESDLAPITYQWRFNGVDIPGQVDSQLALGAVQLPQEGDYSVVVANAFAQTLSQTARLTVKVKPIIVIQPTPTNQVAAVGDTVSFTVTATGSLPMSFRWRRGTANVTNITLMSGTCVFTLPNVQTNQAGKYSVAVTNLAGAAIPAFSSNADLVVLFRPVITNQPVSRVAELGASTSFTVGAGGSGPLSYQWLFNNAPIGGATSATLPLNALQASQQGTYTVVVSNQVGRALSQPATLSLRQASVVSIELKGGGVVVDWTSAPGLSYRLQSRKDLASGDWVDGETVAATDWVTRRTFGTPDAGQALYYRVLLLP